jgi:uncharacterized membrane protein YcgQ (UPF0703/DUF1980 family)
MVTEQDEILLKQKQKELNLTDEQCFKIIEYLKIGFTFSDAEIEFEGYVLGILDRENRENSTKR